jgi:chromosome segregation protein
MRLTHIKIAGFKSFVDPTSFAVQSRLVGVVGPNGCGKSNIIDAVRWVLGESKASELRGESMQDVIFNGSTHRKPASRASVELVFDNQEARAGGHWNQYAEIAVKRVLTRDGSSSYYINQQAVRRRDVQDIFLGTGLGPKAYAIIGQGMIARIIEARPEDLRVFLEEAAGVSKYKERRRETENRLQDTRDNLTRVDDILRELNSQIDRLTQQAEVARQYRSLDEEKTIKQRRLWAIRHQEGSAEQNRCLAAMEAARAELEALNAQSVKAQTELILLRQKQLDAQEGVDARQQQYMEANRTVSKLEADIRVMAEARQRLAQRVSELLAHQEQWKGRRDAASESLQHLDEDIALADERVEETQARSEAAQMAIEPARDALIVQRQASERARNEVVRIEQDLRLHAQRRESALRQIQAAQTRLDRLQADRSQTHMVDPAELTLAREEHALLTEELAALTENRAAAQEALQQARHRHDQAASALRTEQDKLVAIDARQAALTQLHEKLQRNDQLAPWIQDNGLSSQSRVLQKIRVEAGWERALESVLRERINALEVGRLDTIAGFAGRPPPGMVSFVSPLASQERASLSPQHLASRLQCADAALKATLERLLGAYLVADSLQDAVSRRGALKPHEYWITPEGHVVGLETVSFYAERDESAGGLARLQEMDNLDRESKALRLLVQDSDNVRIRLAADLRHAEAEVSGLEQRLQSGTRAAHEAQIRVVKLTEAAQRQQQRLDQLQLDISLIEDELSTLRGQEEEAAMAFETGDEALAGASDRFTVCQDSQSAAEAGLQALETDLRNREREAQEAQFSRRSLEGRSAQLKRDMELALDQLNRIVVSLSETQLELDEQVDEDIRALLEDALDHRISIEQGMSDARATLDSILDEVRQAEDNERNAERLAQPVRDRLQDLTLKEQAARLQIEQYAALMAEASIELAVLLADLEQLEILPKASVLQADVTRLGNSISALGPVNLAALDELNAAAERKGFLDQQTADLLLATETLEDAIRKIDRETRVLLQETFETVNQHFSSLFPQLFGGGEARLVMSGDEILDAGVQVFAHPPGKKNSTIHLLSGGEKALTATALVFAIFQLNPAPFCLLDEVDAPLDDANTERFSRLVQRMSEQTQFLFISHNKIAMEMAQQLIGVTMQEQGVSRIVAVDLDSAVKLATDTA